MSSASSSHAPIEVVIAGRSYRVVSSSTQDEMQRLAKTVEDKLQQLGPGAQSHPQALLLVALALAHDLGEAQALNSELKQRSLQAVEAMLTKVDSALDHVDENGVPLETSPGSPVL